MPFEVRLKTAVAAHAAVARAGVMADVLQRLDVLHRKGFGQDLFRDAQAVADVAQATIGRASVRVAAAVHDPNLRTHTENQSQQDCSTPAIAVKSESKLENRCTSCPSSCVSRAVGGICAHLPPPGPLTEM